MEGKINSIISILGVNEEEAKLIYEFIYPDNNLDMLAITYWICNSNKASYIFQLWVFIKTFVPPKTVSDRDVKKNISEARQIFKDTPFDKSNFENSLKKLAYYL